MKNIIGLENRIPATLKKILTRSGIICTAILAGFSAFFASAQAQTTPWHTVEGGRVRMAIAPVTARTEEKSVHGQPIHGAIEVALEPGWKTYWSNPGSSGMAPEITLDQKAEATILFPVPQLLQDGEDWTYSYTQRVLLAFRIAGSDPAILRNISGSLLIGLCNKICIPEKITFQIRTDEKPDASAYALVKEALSGLPEPAENTFQIREMTIADKELRVRLRHPESTQIPQLFIDGHDVQLGIAATGKHGPDQTVYTVPILSGTLNPGQTAHYIAVLDGRAVAGETAISR